jgi:hypothetical protein
VLRFYSLKNSLIQQIKQSNTAIAQQANFSISKSQKRIFAKNPVLNRLVLH